MKLNQNSLGFTLIELLVSISIIAVLAAIGVVSFTSANRESRNSRRQTDLHQVAAALEVYRADLKFYPVAGITGGNLATISGIDPYLSSTSVVDPVNTGIYVYTYAPAPAGCNNAASKCTTFILQARSEAVSPGTYTVSSP